MDPNLVLETRVARAGFDDHELHGWRVFEELGDEDLASLLSIFVSGRRLDEKESLIIARLGLLFAIADPRIWPLKVTRLIASYGRVLPAIVAGQAFLSEAAIGPTVPGKVAAQFRDIALAVGPTIEPETIEDVVTTRLNGGEAILGWGVPGRRRDERHVQLSRWYPDHGFPERYFWKLMVEMERVVANQKGLQPNIAAATAAILLDLKFEPEQIDALLVSFLHGNFLANAIEGAAQQSETLRRLPPSAVDYRGLRSRRSPRACR
ncbi:MAG: hypothetical protein ACNA8W_01520 [Bradymonadaceae bacterium]